jgi:hypothetical protein
MPPTVGKRRSGRFGAHSSDVRARHTQQGGRRPTARGSVTPPSAGNDEDDVRADLGSGDDDGRDDTGGLEGKRLQLIPHDIDPRYVFRFEFGPAILAQVLEKISSLPITALTEVVAEPNAVYPGFYQLFRKGESVYVGRTIRPIGQRLGEHSRKLRGRVPLTEMGARFLFVEDLSLVGLSEDAMIAYFHPLGLDQWGKMGFGSKATGFNRAGQESDWHDSFPADLTLPIVAGHAQPKTFRQLVASIARGAPLVLSIPKQLVAKFGEEHPGLLLVPPQERPFTDWVADIETRLAHGWRVDRKPMAWYIVRDEE